MDWKRLLAYISGADSAPKSHLNPATVHGLGPTLPSLSFEPLWSGELVAAAIASRVPA